MKALRAEICGTQNLLHNIKSEIVNTQPYIPMDNGYVYANVPTTSTTSDECKVNNVDNVDNAGVCDMQGCTVEEDVHEKEELEEVYTNELDTELDTSPVEDVMEGDNTVEDVGQPQVTKKRAYKRKKAV
tara:strand:+ start:2102 stop:2488 length:387 start_codon:yes stop_codon:yes gene_type:complete